MTGPTPAEPTEPSPPLMLLLSGPNLQLFGQRQPEVYGSDTLEDRVELARTAAWRLGYGLEHVQSDGEAGLVAAVHAARHRVAAILVNAGALSHYGWSLHDALATFDGVVVELHVSRPDAREPWRRTSVLAPVASGTVAGFGTWSYEIAVEAAAKLLAGP
ncbi:MAG: type II 3-dehydroquinate dehydratase [Acidimicrobiales bacterium]